MVALKLYPEPKCYGKTISYTLGKPQKKNPFFNGRDIKALTPPPNPLELNGRRKIISFLKVLFP